MFSISRNRQQQVGIRPNDLPSNMSTLVQGAAASLLPSAPTSLGRALVRSLLFLLLRACSLALARFGRIPGEERYERVDECLRSVITQLSDHSGSDPGAAGSSTRMLTNTSRH